jgi:formate-dependent nitrite reductase membrane component NrfD
VAGVFLAATGVLLVADLKQPRRFTYLLTRPNTRSWLVRGAWILAAYAVAAAAWWVGGLLDSAGWLQVMAAPAAVLGAATAGYTAFLFGQCEGRDLWQTPLLLPTLLAQAVAAGGAVFAVMDLVMDVPAPTAVRWALLGGVLATAVVLAIELTARSTRHVELAVHAMSRGPFAVGFWLGGVLVGLALPAVLTSVALAADTGPVLPAVAGIAAVIGVFAHEDAFVRAGQAVPLS